MCVQITSHNNNCIIIKLHKYYLGICTLTVAYLDFFSQANTLKYVLFLICSLYAYHLPNNNNS